MKYAVGILVLIGMIIWMGYSVGLLGKYEGQTAKEWYYRYTSQLVQYNAIKDDDTLADDMRSCVNKTKNLYREVLAQCKKENNCDLSKLANNGALEVVLGEINKSKIECYAKYFE